LEEQARIHGLTIRTLVAKIYTFAVDNQDKFSDPLSSARRKPGDHIGAAVEEGIGTKLTAWAKDRSTPRGVHCCFILEKALELKSLKAMLSYRNGE
jgi:hypothetical protein